MISFHAPATNPGSYGSVIFTVHVDGTITLGPGVTLDQTSVVFWNNLMFDGKTLVEQRDEAILLLEESREDLLEEQEFDSYREDR